MKHRFTALCTLLSLATGIAGTSAQKLKGSDTLLPLVQKTSESYFHSHPGAEITVTGGGSGVGISALREGTTDIAMASRRMKFDERMKLQAAGHPPVEVTVAFDALAVVVNPANPVSKLTREQLEAIFRGKITNWKEVGGKDGKIVVVSRDSSSGTFECWNELIMKKERVAPSALMQASNGAVVQAIAKNPNAIGYIGLGYLNSSVKGLHVDKKEPTAQNALSKTWPISRELYIFTNGEPQGDARGLVAYLRDPTKGQKNVAEVGYIPLGK
mgnify:CR=1 FL=1